MEDEPARRTRREVRHPARLYRDWKDLVADGGFDVVSVAVPTFLHAPIAVGALDAGIHVLSEKPIARNGVEAQTMVDAAHAAGRVLEVAFNHRRRGDIEALKSAIDAGQIGRPYFAKAAWLRRQGIPGLGSWFTNREMAGGGPLIDIGVHVLDYALDLFGEPQVLAVSACTHSELGPRGRGGNGSYTAAAENNSFEVEDLASLPSCAWRAAASLLIETSWASLPHRRATSSGFTRLRHRGRRRPPRGRLPVAGAGELTHLHRRGRPRTPTTRPRPAPTACTSAWSRPSSRTVAPARPNWTAARRLARSGAGPDHRRGYESARENREVRL